MKMTRLRVRERRQNKKEKENKGWKGIGETEGGGEKD